MSIMSSAGYELETPGGMMWKNQEKVQNKVYNICNIPVAI